MVQALPSAPGMSRGESSITVLVYMSWTGNFGVYFCSVPAYRGLVCWVTDKANTLVLQSQPHKLCKVDAYPCERHMQPGCHPPTSCPFRNGKSLIAKTQRPFLLIATDQGHEQNNATMKGDGGIIGLTEDLGALLRWALAGPEALLVISEFESSIMGTKPAASETRHHGQTLECQKRFNEHVVHIVHVMKNLENPFDEE